MARYDTSKPLEAKQAKARLSYLISKGARVELTEKRKQRTYSQNNYLHLILTAWGGELGYDLDEMKQLLKRDLMPSVFKYERNGRTFYRSTADLNTKEGTRVIDKIRATALESTGYYIPTPNEPELLQSLANEAERYA